MQDEPQFSEPQIVVGESPAVVSGALDVNLSTGKPIDLSRQRHFLAAFFFSFFFGLFGVDRFYMGKIWTGILKLLTFGGLGVWATIDLGQIISGSARDKQGNKLIDAEKYKTFAKRTVFMTTFIIIVIFVASSAIAIYYVMQFVQNGGINQLINNPDQMQSLLNSYSIWPNRPRRWIIDEYENFQEDIICFLNATYF